MVGEVRKEAEPAAAELNGSSDGATADGAANSSVVSSEPGIKLKINLRDRGNLRKRRRSLSPVVVSAPESSSPRSRTGVKKNRKDLNKSDENEGPADCNNAEQVSNPASPLSKSADSNVFLEVKKVQIASAKKVNVAATKVNKSGSENGGSEILVVDMNSTDSGKCNGSQDSDAAAELDNNVQVKAEPELKKTEPAKMEAAAAAPPEEKLPETMPETPAAKSSDENPLAPAIKRLSKHDLETLVLEQMVVALRDRSYIGSLEKKLEASENQLERSRRKVEAMQKQVNDLTTVVRRFVNQTKNRKDLMLPLKITRAVGLQIDIAKRSASAEAAAATSSSSSTPSRVTGVGVQQAPSPCKPSTTPASKTATPAILSKPAAAATPTMIPKAAATPPATAIKVAATPSVTRSATTPITSKMAIGAAAVATPATPTAAAASSPAAIAPAAASGTRPILPKGGYAEVPKNFSLSSSSTDIASYVGQQAVPRYKNALRKDMPTLVASVAPITSASNRARTDVGVKPLPKAIPINNPAASVILYPVNNKNPKMTNNLVPAVKPAPTLAQTPAASVQQKVTQVNKVTLPTPPGPKVIDLTDEESDRVQQNLRGLIRPRVASQPVAPVTPTGAAAAGEHVITRMTPTSAATNGRPAPVSKVTASNGVVAKNNYNVTVSKNGAAVAVPTSATASVPALRVFHPAPLPLTPLGPVNPAWKMLPPKPCLKISRVANGIVLSWTMQLNANHADVSSYQLFAYQEGNFPASSTLWKRVGDVKALPLPMACTLTQFLEGHRYHFAVRAMDAHNRVGPYSEPGSIYLS